jgi:antitoxin component of RelBE/YafQ-DinJ toxin-antitoxin module
MSPTTIKVDSRLRDQINAVAQASGMTAGSLIEMLLAEYLEREILAETKRRIEQTSPENMAEYLAEFRQMDASLNDGLEEYAGEWDEEWNALLKRDPELARRFGLNEGR